MHQYGALLHVTSAQLGSGIFYVPGCFVCLCSTNSSSVQIKRGMRCEFPGRGVGSSQLVLGQKHPKRVNSWEAVWTGLPCPWLQVLLGCAGCSHRNKTQLNPRTEQARRAFCSSQERCWLFPRVPGAPFLRAFCIILGSGRR